MGKSISCRLLVRLVPSTTLAFPAVICGHVLGTLDAAITLICSQPHGPLYMRHTISFRSCFPDTGVSHVVSHDRN